MNITLKMTAELADESEGKSCPINLTNHTYFNLGGHDNPNRILDHEMTLYTQDYCELDSFSVPTKKIIDLTDDPVMDF
jgi:galactose mutarotase-like enzyme